MAGHFAESVAPASRFPMVRELAFIVRDIGFPIAVAAALLWHLLVTNPEQIQELIRADRDLAAQVRELILILRSR